MPSSDSMFALKKPCVNCPFKKSSGGLFGLRKERLLEIFEAPAFQCHKSVDYSSDEPTHGDNPIQCAGLIALHHKEGNANQITQVATRLIGYNPAIIDGSDVFDSYEECLHYYNLCKRG
jgi:hypothetical protein